MWLSQKNPWSTGLGDFVLNDMLFVLVAKPYQTLCDPTDCCQPGSSVHVISQARILEWAAIPSPGDLPNPRFEPRSPSWAGRFFTTEPPGKPINDMKGSYSRSLDRLNK